MNSVHVATFNVNCICAAASNETVALTITQCGADMVCLQETNEKWEAFLSSKLISVYPHIRFHNQKGNKWAGFGILSKYPIEESSWKVIPETERGWYPAGMLQIRMPSILNKKKDYFLLQLLIVHLRAPVEWSPTPYWWGGHANWIGGYFSKNVKKKRLHEIQTFVDELNDELPTIIVGDFNEPRRSSNCLNYVRELGFENTPKKAAGSCSPLSCCHGKNSWRFELCWVPIVSFDYDHIIYSKKHFEPVNGVAYIHKDSGSDHCLVSAEYRFKD